MGNNWKMRCVNPMKFKYYTKGKIYTVVNGVFTDDDGGVRSSSGSFKDWQESSLPEWELVEDELKMDNKIKTIFNMLGVEPNEHFKVSYNPTGELDTQTYCVAHDLRVLKDTGTNWRLTPFNIRDLLTDDVKIIKCPSKNDIEYMEMVQKVLGKDFINYYRDKYDRLVVNNSSAEIKNVLKESTQNVSLPSHVLKFIKSGEKYTFRNDEEVYIPKCEDK